VSFWRTVRLFYQFARPYRKQFALGIIALLAVDLLNVFPPLLLKGFIDQATVTLDGDRNYKPYLWIGLAYAIIAIAQGLCRYLWRIWLVFASYKSAQRLREAYFEKLQRLPPSFYDRHPIGDLMALATNDIEAYRFAVGPALLIFSDAVFLFISLPPVMFWLSPKLSLLALAPMLFLPFAVIKIQKHIHSRFEDVQEQFSRLSGFAQENLEGIRVVKSYAREWPQLRRFSNIGREFVRLNLRLARVQSVFEPMLQLALTLGFVSLLAFAGPSVAIGAISIGTFVAFLRYLDNLAWPMTAFGMAVIHYQRGKTSFERIQKILNEPEEAAPITVSNSSLTNDPPPLLEARGLSFSYENGSQALSNLNFKIKHGSKVALLGPVGSGKSTLVRLLSGLYPIAPGMLFWNGIDVATIPLAERRRQIAIVPQEVFLFSETLQWNVALGGTAVDETSVKAALNTADLSTEAAEWGLGIQVGQKGLNLSGGQRARATLARALVRKVPLLILDDSLSSVDSETESTILTNLAREFRNDCALLMITHRTARIMDFDQVLVLEKGRLIENGQPHELLIKPGFYRELHELQQMESRL